MVSKRILKSEAGFSLVEMMVVAAIVGILMLAFTGYIFQQMKATKEQANNQSYTNLKAGVMDASTQAEALSRSEALQFKNLGATPSPYP
ncbi:MAG: type II secretion system protein [Bdellovibrionales bacterium]|nr:type II secretion system protein [Bdellovibrionales bacterium]